MITGRAITALPLLLLDVINFSIPITVTPFHCFCRSPYLSSGVFQISQGNHL